MSKTIRVTNEKGREFTVRLVKSGECYGRDDCITHEGETMLEFYDATYAGDTSRPSWFDRGQFVSRYYVSTLRTSKSAEDYRGLNLDGGEPAWEVSAENVRAAIALADDAEK